MNCNKCGTPIIPGENTCRICGNVDFSQRVKEPEIIDFPEEIEEKKQLVVELPDLIDIIDIDDNQNLNDINKIEVQKFAENDVEIEAKQPSLTEIPVEQPIDLDEPISVDTTVTEQIPIVEQSTNKVVEQPKKNVEDSNSSKKKVLDKTNEKVEKSKKSLKETRTSNKLGIVLLTLLLMCSLALNGYLFIMDGNAKASNIKTEKAKIAYSKLSYNDYKITVPSTWITENKNNSLLIYDDTQNWSANIQLISDVDYNTFVTNKESLLDSLGNLRYQFTSNYSKKEYEKEFYLFKGKYYNYSVFVIVTELNETSMLVVDLKFKGEVDDILLNNILKAMASAKENNTEELFKDNFEFVNITEQIQTVSKKVETTQE